MDITLTVAAGVISSLIAVGLVELYLLGKRTSQNRKLRGVLGLHDKSCVIVAPVHHQKTDDRLIHYRDAYAFGHLFGLLNRLGAEATFVPYNEVSEAADVQDTICVGGPISNALTNDFLSRFFTGFTLIYSDEAIGFSEPPERKDRYITGFRIGGQELMTNEQEEYAILAKLTPDELDQERTVHLVFGYSGRGGGAAGYFLSKHYAQLFQAFGRRKYCVAIRVSRTEGYKAVSRSFKDLTSGAFEDNAWHD